MRAWALEVSEDERRMRTVKAATGLRQTTQPVRLTRAAKPSKTHINDGIRHVISNNTRTNLSSMIEGRSSKRSRSRSADITPYDEHDRVRDGREFDDSDNHVAEHRHGHLRAWQDEDSCPTAKKLTIAITCEHIGGIVRCTSMAGNEVGEFKVPKKEDPYGNWLGKAVSQAHQAEVGELCLIKSDGTIFWREGLDQKVSSTSKHTNASFRGRRFTGRERFTEGHDDRNGGCFAEYYTPRRRPYSHRDRWTQGHDDRDGRTYADHASSVRPFSDPDGFACQ